MREEREDARWIQVGKIQGRDWCLALLPASAPGLPGLAPLIQRLEVVDADDRRSIFLNGHLSARYLFPTAKSRLPSGSTR